MKENKEKKAAKDNISITADDKEFVNIVEKLVEYAKKHKDCGIMMIASNNDGHSFRLLEGRRGAVVASLISAFQRKENKVNRAIANLIWGTVHACDDVEDVLRDGDETGGFERLRNFLDERMQEVKGLVMDAEALVKELEDIRKEGEK